VPLPAGVCQCLLVRLSMLCNFLKISDVNWETPSLLTVGSSGYPIDFVLKNPGFHPSRHF